MILDSCFLIDLMAEDEGAKAKLEELVHEGAPLATSALSVTEVATGLNRESARETFEQTISRTVVVPYDYPSARRAAQLRRELRDRGEPIGAVDAMIAATALERDEGVVTRNVDEFGRVDALRVSPY